MDRGQTVESGSTENHSAKGPVLHRLASALARTLGRRHATTSQPAEKSDPAKWDYSHPENEEACAKIWSIYVGEAERYDAALVESWKADMEGMLIFSGLFSASLTAFLIESYKVLQPDSGDQMVAGITVLSQQLAAIASNTTFVSQPAPAFIPTTESLWCNALWFISLSLSLTCALLATLVEQWAREFLHKTEMRPSPVRRARVFSFLYFGLKQFRMHTIVDAIPFLLHASLLLFFAGLVAFLLSVNHIMMYLMCTVLFVFVLLYTFLTILPVVRLNCPYRTPLSAPLWSTLQSIFGFFDESDASPQRTMTEAVAGMALQDTIRRDQRALQWTLDSLTDDSELLPFVETVPDIIFGANGFRGANDALFDPLLGTIDVASPLLTRISALIHRTGGMSSKDPLRARRRAAGNQAIWALCMIPRAWDRLFDVEDACTSVFQATGVAASATLAAEYQAQRWVHHLLETLRDLLDKYDHLSANSSEAIAKIQRLAWLLINHQYLVRRGSDPSLPVPVVLFAELEALVRTSNSMPTGADLDETRRTVVALCDRHDWAYSSFLLVATFINVGFRHMIEESDPPFEPLQTCYRILEEIESNPPRRMVTEMSIYFPSTIQNLEFNPSTPMLLDVFARIAFRMMPFFFTLNIHRYLGQRRNSEAIRYALSDCDLNDLARRLAVSSSETRYEDSPMALAVDDITTVANCVQPESVAIRFLDAVFAHGSQDLASEYPVIGAIRYFRQLQKANLEVFEIGMGLWYPPATGLPRLQEICRSELLDGIHPLFLPNDVHIPTVVQSLRFYLVNKCILFLSDFFVNLIPTAPKVNISLDRFFGFVEFPWNIVDPEIQHTFFTAMRTHIQLLSLTPPSEFHSDLVAITEQLWVSRLFWVHFDGEDRVPSVAGINPACLLLLREVLEKFQREAHPPEGDGDLSVDIAGSKMLLVAVRQQLSKHGVVHPLADTGRNGAEHWAEGNFTALIKDAEIGEMSQEI
ncbi:hypothetical protein C8R45DRAFT_894623 [Mycena sanguinolenta]|nr:hypothetical protein C8R45DRAFT_894623 [Mycena sanguinolenta]